MYRLEDERQASDTAAPKGKRPLVIDLDIGCARCGYSLRGLKPSDVCPECGSPVIRSVFGGKVDYCDPLYLRKLWLGALGGSLAAWMLFLTFVCVVVLALGAMGGAGPTPIMTVFHVVTSMVVPACLLALLVSWFVLTAPNPAAPRPDPLGRVRLVERVLIIAGGVCAMVLFVMGMIAAIKAVPTGVYLFVLNALSWGLAILIIAHLFVSAAYMKRLARWFHAEPLEFWASAQFITTIVASALVGLFVIAMQLFIFGLGMLGVFLSVLAIGALLWSQAMAIGTVRRELRGALNTIKQRDNPFQIEYND